jgi:biopolymer transport protein ExbD
MSKKHTYDVWIVHGDMVYKGVPFQVVADWLQQGRLLPEDRVRPTGGEKWQKLAVAEAFQAFVPHSDPLLPGDTAEALEPIEMDFGWKKKEDDDEDVDMIPLIDISLVLLIFFMMTTAVSAIASRVDVPGAYNPVKLENDPNSIWIGIDFNPDGPPFYSIGSGNKGPAAEDRKLTQGEALNRLDSLLRDRTESAEVRVAAHKMVPYDVVRDLSTELEKKKQAGKGIAGIQAEVGDKK